MFQIKSRIPDLKANIYIKTTGSVQVWPGAEHITVQFNNKNSFQFAKILRSVLKSSIESEGIYLHLETTVQLK